MEVSDKLQAPVMSFFEKSSYWTETRCILQPGRVYWRQKRSLSLAGTKHQNSLVILSLLLQIADVTIHLYKLHLKIWDHGVLLNWQHTENWPLPHLRCTVKTHDFVCPDPVIMWEQKTSRWIQLPPKGPNCICILQYDIRDKITGKYCVSIIKTQWCHMSTILSV
jgi:hypothetical protein